MSKRAVMLGMVGTGVITSTAAIAEGRLPPPTVWVGVAIGGAVLLAVAERRPDLAGGLATVVFVTAALMSGATVARAVTGYLQRESS